MPTIINGTDNSASTPALTGTDTDTGVYFSAANTLDIATGGIAAGQFFCTRKQSECPATTRDSWTCHAQ